ncbi:MAG: MFS transporter, partial [Pseudomonadota bacterium]
MTLRAVPLVEAQALPLLRRPFVLLLLMAAAMPIAFSTWSALQVNFAIEAAGFDGKDNGWLHTVREIPGFLAVGVIAVILFMREQVLGLVSLILLGFAVAITAWFPTFEGLLVTTMLSSIGFHYYETVNQSLQLQWLPKDRAPQLIGWLVAMGSAASLVVYGTITFGWEMLGFSYESVYLVGGGLTMVIAFACLLLYPQFESPSPQVKKMVLRRRYWLYYALQFMSGARRQIFIVFAAFMMVEKFGFEVHELTALFLINYVASMNAAPLMGKVVATFGERRALAIEYVG